MEKMKRDRRMSSRFHETLKRIYFPSPPSPPPELETEGLNNATDLSDLGIAGGEGDLVKGEESCSSESERESKKLTRAQRKRLRKKKLKEAAAAAGDPSTPPAQRRRIVGPLLPSSCPEGQAENSVHPNGD